MPHVIEVDLLAKDARFVIVVGRFNSLITERLLEGAISALRRHGVHPDHIAVAHAPGAFEIPLLCRRFAQSGKYDAVIALGAVIRGGTPHFDYISASVTQGIAQSSLQTGIPITFGILTTETSEQAIERAGVKMGNKGEEAALAAIEMVNLLRQIDK